MWHLHIEADERTQVPRLGFRVFCLGDRVPDSGFFGFEVLGLRVFGALGMKAWDRGLELRVLVVLCCGGGGFGFFQCFRFVCT